jgi:hypothetical protein
MTNQTPTLIATDQPFSLAQRALLDRLLDLMIPASADGRLPSAAGLDLYAEAGRLGEPMIVLFGQGLASLDAQSRALHGRGFVDLDDDRAMVLVDDARAGLAPFFGAFVTQSAARYYQHDRVVEALGLEARPPWPQGHQIVEGDWSLLDPVRARKPFYRH